MTTLQSWFIETDYLESKLAELKASGNTQITNIVQLYDALAANGYTPYDHFQAFGSAERTSPNKLFQATEYLEAKAKQMNGLIGSSGDWTADTVALAIKQAGLTIWQHFEQYGWEEGVNPSNSFDIKAYMAAKLAAMQVTDPSYTEAQLIEAFKAAGLSPISHYEAYGKAEHLPVTEVPPADQVTPGGGDTFTLTAGVDAGAAFTGGAGNDVFTAADVAPIGTAARTWTAGDSIDGGAGNNTFNVISALDVTNPIAASVKNFQTVNVTSGANIGATGNALNTTSFTGLNDLNTNTFAAGQQNVLAANSTNVTATAANAAGAASVTVNGGQNVTVNATEVSVAGGANLVTVGNTAAATGDVVVNQTGAAIVAGAAANLGNITVTGGKTITVNQVATSNDSAAVQNTVVGNNVTVVQGTVGITANATTTDVTVNQTAAVGASKADTAVAAVNEVATVTFTALASGGVVTVGGLTFTASKNVSAEQVAQAFANLTADARLPVAPTTALGDTQGSQVSTLGTFSGSLLNSTPTELWSTGAAAGNTVTFTGTGAMTDLTATGATVATTTQGVNAVAGKAGVLGVTTGVVTVAGAANLETVTVNGYATLSGVTGASNNALSTVNLSNGVGAFTIASAAKELALNVNNATNGTVAVNGGTSTLNANVQGKGQTTLQSSTASTLNVSGDGSVLGAAGTGNLAAVTAISTVDFTGKADFTITGGTAYTGGAGTDVVALTNSAPTKSLSLGAGNDTLNLASIDTTATTGLNALAKGITFDGGAGDADVIALSTAQASNAETGVSGSSAFANNHITGFERLSIVDSGGATTVNMANLGGINYVIANGTGAGLLTLSNLQDGGTVQLNAATYTSGTAVTINGATKTIHAELLNVVTTVNAAPVNDFNTLTANNIDTISITATDTTPLDAAGKASIQTATLNLAADAATTINVAGNSNLVLTLDADSKAITTVDASTLTGALTLDLNAAAATQAVTVQGGSGNDVLTASLGNTTTSFADILNGGAGNDTLFAGSNGAQLSGGSGNDLFVMNAATAGNGNVNSGTASVILDFQTGDLLQTGATTFAKLTANIDQSAGLQAFANAAADQATPATGAVWFQLGSDTYVVTNLASGGTDAGFTNGTDAIIKLAGVTGDNLSFNTEFGTVALA